MANHNFNITLACRYGIEEAIIIERLYWWIHHNECEEVEEMTHEGRVWCRSTAKGIAKYIPYMKPDKIWRILRKLEGDVLMVGNFNRQALNQTLWYTFTDEFKKELIALDYDFEKIKNANLKNEKSKDNNIIDNNNIDYSDSSFSKNNPSNQGGLYSEDFLKFWKLYNYPRGKKTAYTRWRNLSKKDREAAIAAVPAYLEDCVRNFRAKQYPATYLNKRTFEDDFSSKGKLRIYDPLDTDSDEKKRFKAWMRATHPEIENTALPLSYEDYMELVKDEEYGGVDVVESALVAIESEIWKYRKTDIRYVIRRMIENGGQL